MGFLKRLLAGIFIGIGAAIPGVSGAAVALIFRVYNDIIEAVNNFRKRFGFALKVLIPILLGIVIALIPCVYLFSLAFEHCMFIIICIFAGFLIGSLPSITDEVKHVKPTNKQIIIMITSFVFVVVLGVLSVVFGDKIHLEETFVEMPVWLYLVLIPVGAIAAVALTVPGLSGSMILLVIGFYQPMVDSVRNWGHEIIKLGDFSNIGKLLGMIGCFAIGCLIGVIFISKVMSKLLSKHHHTTYFAIIAFIIGSLGVLFFNYQIFNYYTNWVAQSEANVTLPISIEIPIAIVCLIIALLGSYLLVRYQRKHSNN